MAAHVREPGQFSAPQPTEKLYACVTRRKPKPSQRAGAANLRFHTDHDLKILRQVLTLVAYRTTACEGSICLPLEESALA
ncbi:hypothetical protein QQF64_032406 [Cirrhinus molitorella]|uniref:Uncharacterized protein n=1 Tax=Cirrhinus molitorella TaxID=172907 RepID=A0ABR3MZU5_9TELE